MANDWIKMRMNLPDDPAVIGISSRTKLAPLDVVARLYVLWCWADEQADDGFLPNVTPAFLDAKVKRAGFAEAMAAKGVEWLVIEPDGVRFPNFDRHNGESAKKRAVETEKKRRQREDLSRKERDNVPKNPGQNRDNCGTREEKSREDKNNTPVVPKGTLQLRAEKLFNRRVDTPLTDAERRAFRKNKPAIEATSEAQWQALERFYAAPQEETFSRKDLATLVNNWNGEIDRALKWTPGRKQGSRPDLPTTIISAKDDTAA